MNTEDIKAIEEFTTKFEDRFKDVLKAKDNRINSFRDYLGYGAESIYTTPIPNDFETTKWRRNPQQGMIWVSTGINPHGVTSEHDIDRTYTIKFEQKCGERRKYGREWHTGTIHHFYGYGRTIDEILEKFHNYIYHGLV